jgi:hypothetical protein
MASSLVGFSWGSEWVLCTPKWVLASLACCCPGLSCLSLVLARLSAGLWARVPVGVLLVLPRVPVGFLVSLFLWALVLVIPVWVWVSSLPLWVLWVLARAPVGIFVLLFVWVVVLGPPCGS